MIRRENDRDRRCIFYKDYGACSCNNEPDDLGECVYDDGYKPLKAQIDCGYFADKSGATEQKSMRKEVNFNAKLVQ